MKRYIYILIMCICGLIAPQTTHAETLPDIVIASDASSALKADKMYVFQHKQSGKWLTVTDGKFTATNSQPLTGYYADYQSQCFTLNASGQLAYTLTDVNDPSTGFVVDGGNGEAFFAPKRRSTEAEKPVVYIKDQAGKYVIYYKGGVYSITGNDLAATQWIAYEVTPKAHSYMEGDDTRCVCTICNHGFFRYEASLLPVYPNVEQLWDAEGNRLTIVKNAYDNTEQKYVLEFNKPLVTIGEKAFMNRKFTGTLTIPSSVTTIGANAFKGCENFSSLVIPESVTRIGKDAFASCSKMTNVKMRSIPEVDTQLGLQTGATKHLELNDNSYVYKSTGNDSYLPTFTSCTYTRTMTSEWGTLVLPFEFNAGNIEDCAFFTIGSYDASTGTLSLSRTVNTIKAGTPLLVRKNTTAPLVISSANGSYNVNTNLSSTTTPDESLTVKGTYEVTNLSSGYIIHKDAFWSVESLLTNYSNVTSVKMAPFRFYLKAYEPRQVKLQMVLEEDATSINNEQLIINNDGKFIENGQVVIVRGGKKYNVNGQIIK